MEDMEISDRANHCVICSASIKFIPGSTPPSDLKLANAFIQCLTLDPAYLEDLTKSCPFCPQCKLKLEEWDFCQNQMVRLCTRLSQLKAGLIAKVLESPRQPMSVIPSKLNCIRQCVKRRFDPRVVLKKTDSPDFSSSNEIHTHLVDSPVNSKADPLITAVSPGKFVYNGKITFSHSSGRLQCDLCAFSCEDGGRGRASIVSHMKAKHYSEDDVGAEVRSEKVQVQEDHTETVDCGNIVHVKLEELNDDRISEDFEMESDPQELDEDPLELEENEQSSTQGTSKDYEYAGVQVTVVGRKHICGRCQKYFEGKNPRNCCVKHIKRCHGMPILQVISQGNEPPVIHLVERSESLEENPQEATKRIKSTPTFTSNLIKELKPGEYLYRGNIPFFFKDDDFTCGRCKNTIRGNRTGNMRRHLEFCEKREIPPGTEPDIPVHSRKYLYFSSKKVAGGRKIAMPIFQTNLIKEVKPGEYVYRDKIPFYYKDKYFTCGRCNADIGGSSRHMYSNLKRHFRRCYAREFPHKSPSPTGRVTCAEELPDLPRPPPPLIAVQNPDSCCLKQSDSLGIPVEVLLSSGQQEPNYAENDSCSSSRSEAQVIVDTIQNTEEIVPRSIAEDAFEDLDRSVDGSVNGQEDPSQLNNVDVAPLNTKTTPTFKSNAIIQVKPGEYLYRDKVPFYYKDKRFTCGLCKATISGNSHNGTSNMSRHLISCEKRHNLSTTELPLRQSQSNMEGPKKTKPPPTFMSDEIKEVKPGEYLYRGKVPFYYTDNRFTCGRCQAVISGKSLNGTSNMNRHLISCEYRQDLSTTELRRLEPMFTSDEIKEVQPGEYSYRDKIPFYFKDGKFMCGRCKVVIHGQMVSMKRHLLGCGAKKGIPHTNAPHLPESALSTALEPRAGDIAALPNPCRFRPILPAPLLSISVQNPNCFSQSGLLLPVSVLLPPQQPYVTENPISSPEAEATVVKCEDAALIVPDVMDDGVDHLERREGDNGGDETDPLQLMKIDFDYLQDEMDGGDAEELLGS